MLFNVGTVPFHFWQENKYDGMEWDNEILKSFQLSCQSE